MRKILIFALALLLLSCLAFGGQIRIPRNALKYRALLRHEVMLQWPGSELAVMAAQVHQESAWNPGARSRYAGGLAQFTPSTQDFAQTKDPELARINDVFNPKWAMRALVWYDKWLWGRCAWTEDKTERWAFTLAAYNGGLGWVRKERAESIRRGKDGRFWFESVETVCLRSPASCHENRQYPRRILLVLRPLYEGF